MIAQECSIIYCLKYCQYDYYFHLFVRIFCVFVCPCSERKML